MKTAWMAVFAAALLLFIVPAHTAAQGNATDAPLSERL